MLGVAVANEYGYHPVAGKTFRYRHDASEWADGLNEHIGLLKDEVWEIMCSSMRGRRISE
jgi:hypothetical protein